MKLTWFLAEEELGSVEVVLVRPPTSRLFLCTLCGKVYGRCVVPGARWMAWHLICADCPSEYYVVPGSLYCPLDREYNDAMPEAVLRREFELLINLPNLGQLVKEEVHESGI